MGRISSGDIADSSFYSRAESGFIDSAEVVRKYNIELYLRFKDDILVIFKEASTDTVQEFQRELQGRCKWFLLKRESVSKSICNMCELTLAKGVRWSMTGFLDFTAKDKANHLVPTLGLSSAHQPTVHRSWHGAGIKRLSKISSTFLLFETVKKRFLARLKLHHTNDVYYKLLEDMNPYFQWKPITKKDNCDCGIQRVRLIMPYHPLWYDVVKKFVHTMNNGHTWSDTLGFAMRSSCKVEVCWRNGAPSLGQRALRDLRDTET